MNGRAGLAAGLTAFATAIGTAVVYIGLNDWFGIGDLRAVTFWSAVVGAYAALAVQLAIRPARLPLRYLLACLMGLGVGLLATVTALFLIGPWVGAFSFPFFVCWITAGLFGTITAVWIHSRRRGGIALVLLVLTILWTGERFHYFREPPPRVVLHLKPGITEPEVQEVWNLLDSGGPISSVSREGRHGDVQLEVSFLKGHRAARDAMLGEFAKSPHIARIDRVDPSTPAKVRVSVQH